jgi:hypothetical protein
VLLTAFALLAVVGVAPGRAATDGTRAKQMGFMVVTPSSGSGAQTTPAELQRVAATGANTAGVTVYWGTTDDQNGVAPEPGTISDDALRSVLSNARSAGLKTMLHLMLHCPTCPDRWRGQIDPDDKDAFFQSYKDMVSHYAAVAAQERVSTLFIGSEMNSVQEDAEAWRGVAATARRSFHGTLSYEVNWDSITRVKFWDVLDLIGVSAYFPLTDEENPSIAHLNKAWTVPRSQWFYGRGWAEELAALSRSTGLRVMFGEVGYRSTTNAAARPFEAYSPGTYSAETQSNAMQSLLLTFEDQSWFAGVTWWDWYLPRSTDDTGFTPRDKSAETVLTRWWKDGWRPAEIPDDGTAPDLSTTAMTTRSGRAPVREGAPAQQAPSARKVPAATGVEAIPSVVQSSTSEVPDEPAGPADRASAPSRPAGTGRPLTALPVAAAVILVLLVGSLAVRRLAGRVHRSTLPAVAPRRVR